VKSEISLHAGLQYKPGLVDGATRDHRRRAALSQRQAEHAINNRAYVREDPHEGARRLLEHVGHDEAQERHQLQQVVLQGCAGEQQSPFGLVSTKTSGYRQESGRFYNHTGVAVSRRRPPRS